MNNFASTPQGSNSSKSHSNGAGSSNPGGSSSLKYKSGKADDLSEPEINLVSTVALLHLSRYSWKWVQLLDNIFSTPKILQRILGFLPFSLVLECCLVNKLWLHNMRNYLRSSTTSSMTLNLHTMNYKSHLTSFAQLMKNCRIYPVSTLRISGSKSVSQHTCDSSRIDEVIKELEEVGKLKVLRLVVNARMEHKDSSCNLLALILYLLNTVSDNHVKYLETNNDPDLFDLMFIKSSRPPSVHCVNSFRYPNLEVLQPTVDLGYHQPVDRFWAWEALETASLRAFNRVVYAHQLHRYRRTSLQALKYCHLFGHIELKDIKFLANGKPELVSFVLYGVGSRIRNCGDWTTFKLPSSREFSTEGTLKLIRVLQKLLRSSSRSLVELRTNLPILNAISQNCNSVLTNLKILDIHYESDLLVKILGSIDFSRNFPNLLTVFIRAHCNHETNIQVPQIFYECDYLNLVPSVTVRNLIVQLNMVGKAVVTDFTPMHLDFLARTFPRLENFSIHNHMSAYMSNKFKFKLLLKALMRISWPGLKRLEIVTGLPYEDVEPVLIGVTKEERQLWRRLNLIPKFKDLQFTQTGPSLLDFPELEFLKFTVHSSDEIQARLPTTLDLKEGLSPFVYDLEHKSKDLTMYKKGRGEHSFTRFWSGWSRIGSLLSRYDIRQFRVNLHVHSGNAEWSLRK